MPATMLRLLALLCLLPCYVFGAGVRFQRSVDKPANVTGRTNAERMANNQPLLRPKRLFTPTSPEQPAKARRSPTPPCQGRIVNWVGGDQPNPPSYISTSAPNGVVAYTTTDPSQALIVSIPCTGGITTLTSVSPDPSAPPFPWDVYQNIGFAFSTVMQEKYDSNGPVDSNQPTWAYVTWMNENGESNVGDVGNGYAAEQYMWYYVPSSNNLLQPLWSTPQGYIEPALFWAQSSIQPQLFGITNDLYDTAYNSPYLYPSQYTVLYTEWHLELM